MKGILDGSQGLVARFEEATGLPREVAMWSVNIVAAIVILIAGWVLAGFARGLVRNLFAKRNIDSTVGGFVGNIAHAGIMAFVVITALGQLGVDTKSFAAIIAAAGLAIGLALQGGLSNFAAGFLIIVFRPFKAGDMIAGAGIEGKVEEVQVFSTTLNTVDNKRIVVPNSALMNGTITNYTANDRRRIDVPLPVGLGQDLAKAHDVLVTVAKADSRILSDPAPAVLNTKLVDLGTQVELRVWAKTTDLAAVTSDLIARAPAALAEAGIRHPDRTVYYQERE
ncbi:MAG: mechanosensitive ion channel [Verrucomicrobia bacterium]|nr:mechanosensitive ion channel [Verrucomicrobiota bacterium]